MHLRSITEPRRHLQCPPAWGPRVREGRGRGRGREVGAPRAMIRPSIPRPHRTQLAQAAKQTCAPMQQGDVVVLARACAHPRSRLVPPVARTHHATCIHGQLPLRHGQGLTRVVLYPSVPPPLQSICHRGRQNGQQGPPGNRVCRLRALFQEIQAQ